jgi:hypothetical protein
MSEQLTMVAMAGFALLGLGILLLAGLKGWQGWLDLKRLELGGAQGLSVRNVLQKAPSRKPWRQKVHGLEKSITGQPNPQQTG